MGACITFHYYKLSVYFGRSLTVLIWSNLVSITWLLNQEPSRIAHIHSSKNGDFLWWLSKGCAIFDSSFSQLSLGGTLKGLTREVKSVWTNHEPVCINRWLRHCQWNRGLWVVGSTWAHGNKCVCIIGKICFLFQPVYRDRYQLASYNSYDSSKLQWIESSGGCWGRLKACENR